VIIFPIYWLFNPAGIPGLRAKHHPRVVTALHQ